MGWESSDLVRFDLEHLLQGKLRIVKLKSTYNLRIIISPDESRIYWIQVRRAAAVEISLCTR